jgi:hypothetical protein
MAPLARWCSPDHGAQVVRLIGPEPRVAILEGTDPCDRGQGQLAPVTLHAGVLRGRGYVDPQGGHARCIHTTVVVILHGNVDLSMHNYRCTSPTQLMTHAGPAEPTLAMRGKPASVGPAELWSLGDMLRAWVPAPVWEPRTLLAPETFSNSDTRQSAIAVGGAIRQAEPSH